MNYQITPIKPDFDKDICHIIKTVGAEFNAVGEGFGPGDAEVTNMSQHYSDSDRSIYQVGIINGKVVGGCGIAAFNNDPYICELRKLFLLPCSRGFQLGSALTISCLEYAKNNGYRQCYLETLSTMKAAIGLYEKLGFVHLSQPLGVSPHNACNVWMTNDL